MNPFAWSFRIQYLFGAICVAALLGYAFFAQFQLGKDPCPLCILQRVAFFAMGVFFLLGALHGPRAIGRKLYALLVSIGGVLGALIAGRHVWLTTLPADEVPACGPGLNYMLDAFPLMETLRKVLTGSGECAKIDWEFLGLSMPAWCVVWFVALTVFALIAGWRKPPRTYASLR
ncbi:disulfide bond formation protein B [Tahibacter sp.]|uniref:disulfide bond formation protein B n=1 Tax=Tahibacter sp. TaxID=2056211 RepID=UPI0028C4FD1B|nr:disulfide bond formation protein B [Tahibacter sp.]